MLFLASHCILPMMKHLVEIAHDKKEHREKLIHAYFKDSCAEQAITVTSRICWFFLLVSLINKNWKIIENK